MRHRHLADAARGVFAAAVAATLLISAVTTRAAAQTQIQTQIAVSGGVGTDQRGTRSSAITFAPALSFSYPRGTQLSLGGNATRYDGNSLSFGGAAALFERDQFAGPLALELAANANASQLNAAGTSASFMSGELVPQLRLDVSAVSLFLGARLAGGRIAQDANRQLVPGIFGVGGGGASRTTISRSRSGVGPTFGVDYSTLAIPGKVLRVGAREDRLIVQGVPVQDRSASASLGAGVTQFSGTVGQHLTGGAREDFGNVGLDLGVGSGVTFSMGGGWYASNPLTGTLPGSYVNAGFTFALGRSRPTTYIPGPAARGAPSVPPGYLRFTLDAPNAKRVELAGDFNEWTPIPAQRAANGVWYADLRLKPGSYRYGFRVNGKEWRVPRGATAVDDGFGGKSAWLTVAAKTDD
ncbi:MAG TPA: glycogen-binding domain-containing protein [Gemmatimonadaceae bacterium]